MKGLLIADKDAAAREEMAAIFTATDYHITTVDSVANALEGILDNTIQVVMLCGTFNEQYVAKFVPLLKKCDPHLSIILVSDEMPLELVRRFRQERIFYHALKPLENESWEEIRQVVACAFQNYQAQQSVRWRSLKRSALGAKTVLTSCLLLAIVPSVRATETADSPGGGVLIALFVAFFALFMALQLGPSLIELYALGKKGVGQGNGVTHLDKRRCDSR